MSGGRSAARKIKPSRVPGCAVSSRKASSEPATIEHWLDDYTTLLEGLTTRPRDAVASLPTVTSVERRTLPLYGASLPHDDLPIHRLIAAQAKRRPAAPAACSGDELLCYAQLEQRSNRLAHDLRLRGAGRGIPGRRLTVAAFVADPTIEGPVRVIGRQQALQTSSNALVEQPGQDPIFLFDATCGAGVYSTQIAQRLQLDRPVQMIHPAGPPTGEAMPSDFEEVVASRLEMVRHLDPRWRRGPRPEGVELFDSPRWEGDAGRWAARLRDTHQVEAWIVAWWTAGYRTSWYDGRLTVLWASEDWTNNPDPTYGWGRLAREVRVERIGGSHLEIGAHLPELVDRLKAHLPSPLTGGHHKR